MKKSFFRERTVNEIKDLHVKKVYNQRGLVERIDDSNFSEDAFEIRTQIIPGRFTANTKSHATASRKCYHHGNLIALSHPKTQEECFDCPDIPLKIRERDFLELRGMREEEINFIGYSCQPRWGDRTKRIFPFVWLDEGVRLFSYDENIAHGNGVDTDDLHIQCYSNALKVKKEGANVVVDVPSRRKKQPRYKFRLLHVPIIRSQYNLATILSLKPALLTEEEIIEPIRGRTLHDIYNIRYTYERSREGSGVFTFYPQDVAAYLKIIKHEIKNHNLTPMEMNPFALPSRHRVEFYKRLCNNVLIFDPTITTKDGLRKLHIDEKSILLARAIGKFGHDDFAYWNPERDGKLKDYNYTIN